MATAKDRIPCKSLSSYFAHDYVRHVLSFHYHIVTMDVTMIIARLTDYGMFVSTTLHILQLPAEHRYSGNVLPPYLICEYFLATK